MSICSSCGAEIIWTKTKDGKRMPLNKKKTVLFEIGLPKIMGQDPPCTPISAHMSHFGSCINAKHHSQKGE